MASNLVCWHAFPVFLSSVNLAGVAKSTQTRQSPQVCCESSHQQLGAHAGACDRAENHLLIFPREQVVRDVAKDPRQCEQLLR